MITKEEFNKVWKDTSREGILNQFYYEHIDLMKYISVLDEIRELLNKNYISSYSYDFEIFKNNLLQILDKVKE